VCPGLAERGRESHKTGYGHAVPWAGVTASGGRMGVADLPRYRRVVVKLSG